VEGKRQWAGRFGLQDRERAKYGEGSIRQLGPDRWQISFYDGQGIRSRESFNTETKAKKRLNTLKALRDAGKLDPRENRTRVEILAGLYIAECRGTAPKSIKWIERVWKKHLEPAFGGFLAARINTEKLIAYRNQRLEGASTSTINRELAILRAMFYHGYEDYDPPKVAGLPKFPEKFKEPNPREGFIDDSQFDLLLANCKQAGLRAMITIAYTFGLRKGECLALTVGRINMKDRTIMLPTGTTKSGKGRVVKMTNEVFALLRPCVEGKKAAEAVFTWDDGSPIVDFRGSWKAMTKAAGLHNLIFHDFRCSAIRNMIEAGVDRDTAKKISGHVTDSVFSRYAIVDPKVLENATAKMELRRNGHKMGTEQVGVEQSLVSS
jgi:integrase